MEIRVLLTPPHSDEQPRISADALSHMIEDLQAPGRTLDLSMEGMTAHQPARVLHAETQWGNALAVTLEVSGPIEAMLRKALTNPAPAPFSMGCSVETPTAPTPPTAPDPFQSLTDAVFTLSRGEYNTPALPEALKVRETLEALIQPMGLRSFPYIHLTVSKNPGTNGEIHFELFADWKDPRYTDRPGRVGFVCDPNTAESSWYYASCPREALEGIKSASGLLSELTLADYQRLIKLIT